MVRFVGVMVTHPSSPAQVEFETPGVGAKMLNTLNGAPMHPPPKTAGEKDCKIALDDDAVSSIG